MTLVGLEYLKQQETARSNRAREAETKRANVALEKQKASELSQRKIEHEHDAKIDYLDAELKGSDIKRKAASDAGQSVQYYWEEFDPDYTQSERGLAQFLDALRMAGDLGILGQLFKSSSGRKSSTTGVSQKKLTFGDEGFTEAFKKAAEEMERQGLLD